jgi:hypothetical protein
MYSSHTQQWKRRGDAPTLANGKALQLASHATIDVYESLDGVPNEVIDNAIISCSSIHASAFKHALERAHRGGYLGGLKGVQPTGENLPHKHEVRIHESITLTVDLSPTDS